MSLEELKAERDRLRKRIKEINQQLRDLFKDTKHGR